MDAQPAGECSNLEWALRSKLPLGRVERNQVASRCYVIEGGYTRRMTSSTRLWSQEASGLFLSTPSLIQPLHAKNCRFHFGQPLKQQSKPKRSRSKTEACRVQREMESWQGRRAACRQAGQAVVAAWRRHACPAFREWWRDW